MVTMENYEEYLMMDADGELDLAGKKSLEAFFEAHPELAGEAHLWSAAKLQPDAACTYPHKQRLLKREPKTIAPRIKWGALAAAAATAAIWLIMPVLRSGDSSSLQIAHRFDRAKKVPSQEVQIASAAPVRPLKPLRASIGGPFRQAMTHRSVTTRVQAGTLIAHYTPLTSLEIVSGRSIGGPASRVIAPLKEPQFVPCAALPVTKSGHESSLPAIVLADENKPAVALLRRALDDRILQARSAARTIRETTVAIRIGHGAVNINF